MNNDMIEKLQIEISKNGWLGNIDDLKTIVCKLNRDNDIKSFIEFTEIIFRSELKDNYKPYFEKIKDTIIQWEKKYDSYSLRGDKYSFITFYNKKDSSVYEEFNFGDLFLGRPFEPLYQKGANKKYDLYSIKFKNNDVIYELVYENIQE